MTSAGMFMGPAGRLAAVFLLASALSALAPAGVALATFQDGIRAYDSGDFAAAYREWLPLAEKGDPAAMRNIAHLLRFGRGVEKDLERAAAWYRRAADMGFDRAQANLGALYLSGHGVPQDYGEAARWFESAARQGHTVAQYNLGLLYEHGLGVRQSDERSLAWYNLAARSGHPHALEKLTEMVTGFRLPASGPGIPPRTGAGNDAGGDDSDEMPRHRGGTPGIRHDPPILGKEPPAVRTAETPPLPRPEAADSERDDLAEAAPADPADAAMEPESRTLLQSLTAFFNPGSRRKPQEEALAAPLIAPDAAPVAEKAEAVSKRAPDPEQWREAAAKGEPEAEYHLGLAYRDGTGLNRDPVLAYMWLARAARQQHGPARAALAAIAGDLTEAQRNEAEALSAGLTPP